MVSIQFDSSTATSRFFVAPNRALPWRDVMRFYLGMVFVSFGIAIAFAVSGLWMVLPFAGAEMLALGVAFYVVARRGTYWQVIVISRDRVEIEDHGVNGEGTQGFQRAWAQIELERSVIKGYPSRLLIRSHGQAVEVGGCLNELERQRLAKELRDALQG